MFQRFVSLCLIAVLCSASLLLAVVSDTECVAQHHHGGSASGEGTTLDRPKILLDKSSRVVAYQLGRLENDRLLLVERNATDPKYIPVYDAILTRAGLVDNHRQEALEALAKLQQRSPVSVLVDAIGDEKLDGSTVTELTALLVAQPAADLQANLAVLETAATSKNSNLTTAAMAALLKANQLQTAVTRSQQSATARVGLYRGVTFLQSTGIVGTAGHNAAVRPRLQTESSDVDPGSDRLSADIDFGQALRPLVVDGLAQDDLEVRQVAITTLAGINYQQAESFALLVPFVGDSDLRQTAIEALLQIPSRFASASLASELVSELLRYAEGTPVADRTSDNFLNAMQLADQVLVALPRQNAKEFRQRLADFSVRVIRIKTVKEEMRYDVPYFAVQAGLPVQVIIDNEDLMPHNFVVTATGQLREVAAAGLQVGPSGGRNAKQYVPDLDSVLHATDIIMAGQQARLTFDAPEEPGEYPYVCTFPQHWQRMYGVMIVVSDLDAWLRDPVPPEDPIGSQRQFVQQWQVSDFEDQLHVRLQDRDPTQGERLFAEASCRNCHQMHGVGGRLGPELTMVFSKWKADPLEVLREILEPSYRIDEKYAMQIILTADGRTLNGLVVHEDADELHLLENPDAPQPLVIPQDEIEEVTKSRISIMPKALLDQYTEEEILDLLAYLCQPPQ